MNTNLLIFFENINLLEPGRTGTNSNILFLQGKIWQNLWAISKFFAKKKLSKTFSNFSNFSRAEIDRTFLHFPNFSRGKIDKNVRSFPNFRIGPLNLIFFNQNVTDEQISQFQTHFAILFYTFR